MASAKYRSLFGGVGKINCLRYHELSVSELKLIISISPFALLTKYENHIYPNATSYWRHLTVQSHEIYEKIFVNCKGPKGTVSRKNISLTWELGCPLSTH